MNPRRIQLKRTKGWKMPANTVKVDRSTRWGNPFRVGLDGDVITCLAKFRSYVCHLKSLTCVGDAAACKYWNALLLLRGKNLACWCRPGEPCHADILLELANAG